MSFMPTMNELSSSDWVRYAGPTLATSLLLVLIWVWFSNESEVAADYSVPVPEQCHPSWDGKVLDEPKIKVSGDDSIHCYCPANGKFLGRVTPATERDIDIAIEKASDAQTSWSRTTFAERRKVLKTMLKFVLENQDTIATVACLDSGKTQIDALFGEILVTAEKLKWVIDHGEKSLKPERRPTNFLMFYKKNEVRWEPRGVVAACVSWNYPFHNLFGPIISSIFAGNGIIIKGSEQTAWSSAYFTRIARCALSACGHSPDLIQSIQCWPSTAPYLTSHPSISHLTFIGSRPVAHHVAASAAASLTETCIELGGKDPAIILDDAASDLPRIIPILMRGVFQSAGQNCIGIERVIALPAIHDMILARVLPLIKSLKQGSILDQPPASSSASKTIDIGASISSTSFPHLEALIAEAVAQGATLHTGGKAYTHPEHPRGHYFPPTLLSDVTTAMRISRTELFAPVFLLMRADDVGHALRIANSTPYALGASVFGRSSKDLEYLTKEISAGMVAVNDFGAYYVVQLPFGGIKGSGYGRFAGVEGLRSVCWSKSVITDRFPLIKTSIPPILGLPGGGTAERMWDFGKGVVEVGYGETLSRRVKGIRRFIGL